MPHLNEVAKKYAGKGLVVMSGSDEAKGTIEPWLASKGVDYPIFVDDGGATARAYGVSAIPDCALIGPDGKVAYKGHPSSLTEKLIEEVLARVVLRFEYEFPAAFRKVQVAIAKKDFAGAWKALDTAAEADADFATKVRDDLTGYVADVRKMAEADAAAGDYPAAMNALTALAKQYKGTDAGKEIDALVAEWKKDPAVKKELDAGKQMAAAKAQEKAFRFKDALGIYLGVVKKYEGTKTAAAAKQRADVIQDGRLWKIDPGCKKCTGARAPCDKHKY